MRELKFRAWNKKDKQYEAVGFHIIGEVTVFDLLDCHSIESFNNFEIEQFTGFKDRLGNDIYEGDILRVLYRRCSERGEFDDYEENFTAPVVWVDGGFVLEKTPYVRESIRPSVSQVIGNIRKPIETEKPNRT